jgi:hypothetical protein
MDVLLEAVGRRLPENLAFNAAPGAPPLAEGHPLALEVKALRAGQAASLPYPTAGEVAWFSLAPTHEMLRRAIADLRAWVFPSLGWEDPVAPIVLPGSAQGALGVLIIRVSPAGYFRWHTTNEGLGPVLARLHQMRRLDVRRPVQVAAARPTLFELRHRFQVALGVGDAAAAQATLTSIDADQLDSAVNTGFMRLRMYAAFADERAIVSDPSLLLLLQMHLPSRVRTAVLEAHHRLFLETLEAAGELEIALARYRNDLHDLLSNQIADVLIADGDPETPSARLIAYRHVVKGEATLLGDLAARHPADAVIAGLLSRVVSSTEDPTSTGPSPAPSAPIAAAAVDLVAPPPPDSKSIHEVAASPAAGAVLRPVEAPSVDISTGHAFGWADIPDAFRMEKWSVVEAFLAVLQQESAEPTPSGPVTATTIADALLEIATLSRLPENREADERFDRVLLAAVDFSEPALSKPEHKTIYGALLPIWSERRRKSSYVPDGHLLLALGACPSIRKSPSPAE